MSKHAPKIDVVIKDVQQTVVFDFGKLIQIEEVSGFTVYELFDRTRRLMRNDYSAFGVKSMVKVIAACLDITTDEVVKQVPADQVFKLFITLAVPLATAIADFLPAPEETASENKENPQQLDTSLQG